MAHYLICYDIANPKRLAKIHRIAVNHAVFVQYSVYYLNGDKSALDVLLNEMQDIIHETEDDIRAYTVAPLKDALKLGISWLPDEILLSC